MTSRIQLNWTTPLVVASTKHRSTRCIRVRCEPSHTFAHKSSLQKRRWHGDFACPVLIACLYLAWACVPTCAQSEGVEVPGSARRCTNVHDLIRQLGAERFSERESATAELIEAGISVVHDLQQALEHPDREIRRRAKHAIAEIARLDRPRRLALFRRGVPSTQDPALPQFGIPGMDLMFAIAGDTADSRKLLTSALQRDWDFCEAVLQPNPRWTRLVDTKCAELRSHPFRSSGQTPSQGEVVAILLGAVNNPSAISDSTAIAVYSLVSQLDLSSWNQVDTGIWSSPAFRRLIGELIICCDGPTATYQGLNMSLRFNLPEGLQAAERVLRDSQSLPFVRQYAILAIARFGNPDHVVDLHRLIDDKQVCFSRRTTLRHSNFECQVRDLALASMLHLLGRDPRQFGFVHLQRSDSYVFQPHTVGFETDDDRKLALLNFQFSTAFTGLP